MDALLVVHGVGGGDEWGRKEILQWQRSDVLVPQPLLLPVDSRLPLYFLEEK